MGSFNLGGFARGVSQGLEDVSRFENIKENREEREYRKKTREEADAYKAERKALLESSPVYQFYRDEQQQKQETEKNPVTRGLTAPMQGAANPDENNVVIQAGEPKEPPKPPMADAINPSPGIGAYAGLTRKMETPKPKPKEVPGLNDHLDLGIRATMLDLKYGKGDGAGFLTLLKTRNTMEREGVTEALQRMNTGDIEGGMQHFNGVGKYRGAQVVNFKQGTRDLGNGITLPTYLVTVRHKDGNLSTIDTAASLYQTQKADDLIKRAIEMRKQGETERHNRATEGTAARAVGAKEAAVDAKSKATKPVKYPQRNTVLDAQDLIKSDPELAKLGEEDQKKLAFNVASRMQKILTETPGTDASEAMSTALEEEAQNITPGEQRSRLGFDWLAKDKPPAYVDRRRTPMPAAAQQQPVASTPAQPVRIGGDDDYHALPSGTLFIDPDGVARRKP